MQLDEVNYRTDLKNSKRFGISKYLGKSIEEVSKKYHREFAKKPEYHSTMANGKEVHLAKSHSGDKNPALHTYLTTKDGKVDSVLSMHKRGASHHVESLVGSPGSSPHFLYHHLITKHNHIITTDSQSEGGRRVWQNLSKLRNINIHGRDPKTGKVSHVDLHNLPGDTHVADKDLNSVKRDPSTSPKNSMGEIKDMRKTQRLQLVAHRKIKEETSAQVALQVIKEELEKRAIIQYMDTYGQWKTWGQCNANHVTVRNNMIAALKNSQLAGARVPGLRKARAIDTKTNALIDTYFDMG